MRHRSLATLVSLLSLAYGCTGYQEVALQGDLGPSVVESTYKHKYGVEVSKADWESRGCDGQIISRLKNGVTVSRSYVGAVLQGPTTSTFPHSQTLQKVDTYDEGTLVKEMWNYTSGLPREEHEHLPGGSTVVTKWYESGSSMSVEEIRDDRLVTGRYYSRSGECDAEVVDGQGERKDRDAYGQLVSVDVIQDGMMASCTTFHASGTPKEVIPYVRGKVHGTKRTFLPGGEPNTTEAWFNGKQHGITICYRNGEKYAEVPYEQGKRRGVERRFRDGQVLEEEITWMNDERHGPTKAFVGGSVKTDWYYQGKLVSKIVFEQMSHA